jgi:hypothetical protein
MGQPPAAVTWGGRRWYLNGGYYMSRDGRMLHRAVYRHHHGEIPAGYDVHHKDEDKTNWSPDNLEALPRSDHLKRHRSRGAAAASREERQERAWRMWGDIPPRDVSCQGCGTAFQSTGMRAKFCSAKCKCRYYKRQKIRTGRVFKKTRLARPCPVCGNLFRSDHPQVKTCSVECSKAHRKQTWATRRERGMDHPNRGRQHTPEARAEMSAARKGKPKPPGFGEKIAAANRRRATIRRGG